MVIKDFQALLVTEICSNLYLLRWGIYYEKEIKVPHNLLIDLELLEIQKSANIDEYQVSYFSRWTTFNK